MIVYQHPGLAGLELWQGMSGHATLFDLRDDKPAYFRGLRDFLEQLRRGDARSREEHDERAFGRAIGFDDVVFCGGEADHPLLAESMNGASFPHQVGAAGPYSASAGAACIFREMIWMRGLALDLGQSRLKVISAQRCREIPRDTFMLPLGALSLEASRGIARLRYMLDRGLMTVRDADGVVLGLPVALDAAGVARPSTYPGLYGPVQPLFADLFSTPWVVVNDAVLAARGFPPPAGRKRLVVTLGFGIGGALWG
jgi:hypothetical protein